MLLEPPRQTVSLDRVLYFNTKIGQIKQCYPQRYPQAAAYPQACPLAKCWKRCSQSKQKFCNSLGAKMPSRLPDPGKVERLLASIEKHPFASLVVIVLASLASVVTLLHK